MVGAQRRPHHRQKAPQDAVFVSHLDGIECGVDRRHQFLLVIDTLASIIGIKARMKQLHQLPRDRRVFGQCQFDVLLTKGKTGLLQIFGVSAQQHDFVSVERSRQRQPVEAVVLDLALPDERECCFEFCLDVVEIEIGESMREAKVVNVQWYEIIACDHIRALALDVDTHVFEHRERDGKWCGVSELDEPKTQRMATLYRVAACRFGPIQ